MNGNGDNESMNMLRTNSSTSDSHKRSITDILTPTTASSQTAFANKFRRLRACARCHRLKMRCVFEDPTFESCTRCFKGGLRCSLTDDPTQANAKARPRKRSKLKGDGPLAQLQHAINESNKLFQSIQRGELDDTEDTTSETLSTLQFQLSETQRLILHAINAKKVKDANSNDSPKSDTSKTEASSINSMKEGIVKSIPSLPWISYDLNIMKELIKLGILTVEDARYRTDYFLNNLHSYWPCVSFPSHYTYDWLLENEPLVLLSFITVTSLNDPDLHDALLYYLEDNLSVRTSITGNISVSFIQIYLVLSLWCSPPRKWGSYKHQMSLLMALNLTLCLDLGNEVYKNTSNILSDASPERHMIRSYMAVYACCGSLGLSLPRFKVVNWTPVHERCSQILLMGESNEADKFLYFYSKLVALGEEIFQFLCPNGFPNVSVRKGGSIGSENDYSNNNYNLRGIMVSYEKRMQKLAMESNLFNSSSKMRNLLSIIYYQLLMTMYDYIVCRVLLRRDILTEVYLQTLTRLIKASEKVIDSFIILCDQTSNFPTFFYYRPMHALVALIRARLLVKTQQLDFEVNVEQEYEKVLNGIKKISDNSKVANKMGAILTRISKWMKVSSKFNKTGASNSMVDLLNELGKEKAVESIKVNLNRDKDGDNMNLSNDSRIQFNKFVQYNVEDMKNKISGTTVSSIPLKSQPSRPMGTSDNMASDAEDRSNSVFVPSPIGYSNSEIFDMSQQQTQQRPVQQNTARINSEEPIEYSKVLPTNPTALYNFAAAPSSSQLLDTIGEQINLTVSGKRESMSEQGTFFSTKPLSIDQPEINAIPTVEYTDNNAASCDDGENNNGVQLQQQEFLNDIFTQIDTDIMNSEEMTTPNGLSVVPMFDFLGNFGYQTNLFGGDLPIPEDWYKSL